MNYQHLPEKEIQRLIDLPERERQSNKSYLHVQSCQVCRNRFRSTELIHDTLRKQQVEPVDEVQVERIIRRVRSQRADSLLVPLLQRFTYVVALTFVLGIVGVIFYQFDILEFAEVRIPATEATGIFWEYYKSMQEQIASLGGAFTEVYDRIFGVETFPILAFTILLLFIIAVLDKWLLSSLLRRG